MDFGQIFMRQSILLGHFLCDRVQGVERFDTQPRHFPSQVPPPPGFAQKNDKSSIGHPPILDPLEVVSFNLSCKQSIFDPYFSLFLNFCFMFTVCRLHGAAGTISRKGLFLLWCSNQLTDKTITRRSERRPIGRPKWKTKFKYDLHISCLSIHDW